MILKDKWKKQKKNFLFSSFNSNLTVIWSFWLYNHLPFGCSFFFFCEYEEYVKMGKIWMRRKFNFYCPHQFKTFGKLSFKWEKWIASWKQLKRELHAKNLSTCLFTHPVSMTDRFPINAHKFLFISTGAHESHANYCQKLIPRRYRM